MHWLWFALISLSSMSVASLLQRRAMQNESSDPITSSIIFQFLLAALSAFIGIYIGFRWPNSQLLPYFLLSGILYAAGTYGFFRAAKLIEASEISIISGAGTIFPVIVSMIVLSERLKPTQWIGLCIIITSIIYIQYNKKHFQLNKGALFALLGTTCYGIAVVFDGLILRSYDTFSYIPIISFLPGLFLILAFPKKLPKLIHDTKKVNIHLFAYSIVYVIGAEAFYFAIRQGAMISQLTTVTRASIILTVIMAMIFLNERSQPWRKLVGAIFTTIGILLIK